MVVHAFNPSTWEAEAGRSLCVQGQPGLQSQFQASWSYRETLSQKYKKKKSMIYLDKSNTLPHYSVTYQKMLNKKRISV